MQRNRFANSDQSPQDSRRIYVEPNEIWMSKHNDHDGVFIQKSVENNPNAFLVYKVSRLSVKIAQITREMNAIRFLGVSSIDGILGQQNYHDDKLIELEKIKQAAVRYHYMADGEMVEMNRNDIDAQYSNRGMVDPNLEIYWPRT